jgi:hypothetical protein
MQASLPGECGIKCFFILKTTCIFAQQLLKMEQTKKNTTIWWLVFFASAALQCYAIYDHWEYLTLILPFVCTSFVKAMDII